MRLYEFEQLEEKGRLRNAIVGAGALAAAYGMTHDLHKQPAPTEQSAPADLTQAQKVLALTMWGEARNQGEEGMRAVGHVIKNRADANDPKFGQGIQGVALAPKQFSAWNSHDPNKKAMHQVDNLDPNSEDYQAWQTAQKLAVNILNGSDSDPTGGATYYHTTAVHPRWAKSMEPTTKIGSHVFYNES